MYRRRRYWKQRPAKFTGRSMSGRDTTRPSSGKKSDSLLFVRRIDQFVWEEDRSVPTCSLSRGWDDTVYVSDINQPSFALSFLFSSCVCFCLYGPFNCISYHTFSRQLSAFSLCSSGLISALLVLSTIIHLFMKVFLSP